MNPRISTTYNKVDELLKIEYQEKFIFVIIFLNIFLYDFVNFLLDRKTGIPAK